MSDNDQAIITTDSRPSWPWSCGEIVLILLVFFVFAGWPAPDVNEAHYLTKAKHYWNPDWCEGDFFLESADAHSVFYWSFGWTTLFCSLTTVAWIGRILTWSLLAIAWQSLSFSVVPKRGYALLSAAVTLCLNHRCHMAGEWLVGGVEAKGFAFICILFGLVALVRQRWNLSWLLMGVATAFHVLVGGWSLCALGFAWLFAGQRRPPLMRILPGVIAAVAISCLSLVPALSLSFGTEPGVTRWANWIYVFERLPHHLVFNHILYDLEPPLWFACRFAALAIVWLVLWWATRDQSQQFLVQRFVSGAAVICLLGVVIDQSTLYHPHSAAALLRYYWFRLSDVMIPVGASLASLVLFARLQRDHGRLAAFTLCMAIVAVGSSIAAHHFERTNDFRPASSIQQRPVSSRQDAALARNVHGDWVRTCRWIDEQTEPSAMFLTPRYQQTFSWYANRAEVVNWKNVPQDATSLIRWRARFRDVYSHRARRGGFAALPIEELHAICAKYHVDYVILDRALSPKRLPWQRVYPERDWEDSAFEVYRVDR